MATKFADIAKGPKGTYQGLGLLCVGGFFGCTEDETVEGRRTCKGAMLRAQCPRYLEAQRHLLGVVPNSPFTILLYHIFECVMDLSFSVSP